MFLIFLAIFIPALLEARVDTGADFLKFITGARATGLAGAIVGLADDVSSLHYNPAGISEIEKNELLFMESEAIMECGYEYFGFTKRVNENSGIGFAILYFHAPEMLRTKENKNVPEGYEILGTIEYYDLMASLSYGKRIKDHLSIGGTIKGIHRMISPDKGYTGAIDFGMLYKHKDNMKFGLSIQNIGPDIWGDKLPMLAQIGGSYRIESLVLTSTISHHLLSNSSFEYRVGAEYWYWKNISLRAGYYSLEGDLTGATLGCGVRLRDWFQFDFAQFPASLNKPLQGSLIIRF
ncbi:MAG: PorV/PorQ family protein [bacterium]